MLIEDNFLSGGGYTLYITNKDQGGGDPTNVTVRNNVFEKDSWGNIKGQYR